MRDGTNDSPSVTPRRPFFEVGFPIYPYREDGRDNLFSLNPITLQQQTYPNPLLIALGYKEALDSEKYRNQTDLAKSLNVTPARISQYLRLLKLPKEIRESVIRMGDLSSPREITERRLRGLLSRTKVRRHGQPPEPEDPPARKCFPLPDGTGPVVGAECSGNKTRHRF